MPGDEPISGHPPTALRYGDGALPLPPDTPGDVLRPEPPDHATPAPGSLPGRVAAALDDPVGREPLRPAGRDVLVVCSDATRRTGLSAWLPVLLDRLGDARSIEVLVACGRHRAPDDEEVRAILGPAGEGLPVEASVASAEDDFVDVGETSRGTPVAVHRAVREADLVVATGSVDFHYFAGATGGRKAIVPGTAAERTIVRNHRRTRDGEGRRRTACRPGVLEGNPVHEDLVEAARLARPDAFLVDVCLRGEACWGVAAGDLVEAHRRLVEELEGATRGVEARDLLLVGTGAPRDGSLLQAQKVLEHVLAGVRPGGVILWAARCPEGVGHPEMVRHLARGDPDRLRRSLRERYRVYGQTALALREKAERCRVLLRTGPELDRDLLAGAGIEVVPDLEEGRDRARVLLGTDRPSTWVVPDGTVLLLTDPDVTPRA